MILPAALKIAVIIICRNSVAHIRECLENVATQGYAKAEHLVIDGASTDGTGEVVRAFAVNHPQVRLVLERDRGQAAALDWATRRVLAWCLSISMTADFCVEAVEEAIAKYGKPEIFNTDKGSQFTEEWPHLRWIVFPVYGEQV